jgi:hypothetical protein
MSTQWICPCCAQQIAESPVMSRVDGKTEICDSCSVIEAIYINTGHPVTFDEWTFPPESEWVYGYFGDGLRHHTGRTVRFVKFTRNLSVLVYSHERRREVSIQRAAFLRMFRRVTPECPSQAT